MDGGPNLNYEFCKDWGVGEGKSQFGKTFRGRRGLAVRESDTANHDKTNQFLLDRKGNKYLFAKNGKNIKAQVRTKRVQGGRFSEN